MARLKNRNYYDEFADWYERERHHGYHALIDDLETDLVLPHCQEADVLEIGCGTGLILRRVAPVAHSAVGLDISGEMLKQAKNRGLEVVQGTATQLPFADASFDTVYSFKVLSHVDDIESALEECARVTRPGGRLFLEFYNRKSLRYVAKKVSRPGAISSETDESAIYTRWYTRDELLDLLPTDLEFINIAGVRVATVSARVHHIPGVRALMRRAEYRLRDSSLAHFGGFLVLELCRRPEGGHP